VCVLAAENAATSLSLSVILSLPRSVALLTLEDTVRLRACCNGTATQLVLVARVQSAVFF
jgi:hypothetical protein